MVVDLLRLEVAIGLEQVHCAAPAMGRAAKNSISPVAQVQRDARRQAGNRRPAPGGESQHGGEAAGSSRRARPPAGQLPGRGGWHPLAQ